METPILDFVRAYASADVSRLHMPGHKGVPFLGCEPMDITEVCGADALYEAEGIIARSEALAAGLFGTGKTLYATEGSSQCVRAMVQLALTYRQAHTGRTIVAARNAHKAFVYAAALLDFAPVWIWPEETDSLCSCIVTPDMLIRTLDALPEPPAAVYVTSPDYLGIRQDIGALAQVCHARGTYLLVDNAHGAYLHFLQPPAHPMDLGADLCCDSAHKTLPVLTGGAYLHLAKTLPADILAKPAMALFGSTSPSYLTLASLDACNEYLSNGYSQKLAETAERTARLRRALQAAGVPVRMDTEPLKLTLHCSAAGLSGTAAAERLRQSGMECEFADKDFVVCMLTPENPERDYERLWQALSRFPKRLPDGAEPVMPMVRPETVCSPRRALLARQELVPVSQAVGRICGTPTVSCPPAIPVVVSGERIDEKAAELLLACGIKTVSVVTQQADGL